jgi:hypothetical protein
LLAARLWRDQVRRSPSSALLVAQDGGGMNGFSDSSARVALCSVAL